MRSSESTSIRVLLVGHLTPLDPLRLATCIVQCSNRPTNPHVGSEVGSHGIAMIRILVNLAWHPSDVVTVS